VKIHGGVEKGGPKRLTLCGIIVSEAQAPYSQPVRNITCQSCRRIILARWKAAIEERAHTSGYTLNK
jgi:NMD protein affecting ribosome stability and mRNA decay